MLLSQLPLSRTQNQRMAPTFFDAKPSSQALLQSPFSPVFEFELDSKKHSVQLERCCSERALLGPHAGSAQTLLQQILALCRCSSAAAAQLHQQLQHLRATVQATVLADGSSMDVEAMACELLASGYLVQVRDGAQQQDRRKNTRSCLQNLRHRFIVCLGWRSSAHAEPEYLPEPLVVEPRFREQFSIAHPSPQFESILQGVPACFVGSVANLEAVVKLMCEQMVASYKMQGLPVPPWRTRQALLSKWSPSALAELALKIQSVRRLSVDMTGSCSVIVGGIHGHDGLRNGARPAAVHTCHTAVGSAPPVAGGSASSGHAVQAFAAAALQTGISQQLTTQQPMAIIPPDMQQQLCHMAAPATASTAVAPGNLRSLPEQTTAPAYSSMLHRVGAAAVPVSFAGDPLSATAIDMAAAGSASNSAVFGGCAGPSCGVSDVLALLAAVDPLSGSAAGTDTLKFTRKGSAEWKHQRSNGRKIKGLLAAALKRPSGSRSSFATATSTAAYGSAPGAAAPIQQALCAKDPDGTLQRGQAGLGNETDALIRRTHYRTSGDEPWRRITTVRWGAYAAQQAAQQATQSQAATTPAVC